MFVLTGGFFTVWFADFAYPTTSLRWHTVLPTFAPQIDISFSIDETRISLLLAFFLLGGGEDDEDEDFILSEQGDLEGAEDVIAPRFFSNLGTTRAENSGLYLKRCAIFSFILANNLRGRLPYADTATASLGLTF